MTSVLAGKKFTPPFKGQAELDYTKPVTKSEKGMVTTTIMVKNNARRATRAPDDGRDLVRQRRRDGDGRQRRR